MPFVIGIFTLIFLFISLASNSSESTNNPLFAHFLTVYSGIANNTILFFLAYIFFVLVFIRSSQFEKSTPLVKKIFSSTIQFLQTIFIGFFCSFALLFVIAFAELNIMALIIKVNPAFLGIIRDTPTIVKHIQANNQPPLIIASNREPYKEVSAVAMATTGTSSVFGAYILPTIPGFLILPVHETNANLLLIDNTLIITNINLKDLQTISPIMGYVFVRAYFPDRIIKSYPKMSIMDQAQYNTFRKEDTQKKLQQVEKDIEQVDTLTSTTSARIDIEKKEIADNQSSVISVNTQKKAEYNACLAAGYDRQGIFYRYHTDQECQQILNQITITKQLSPSDLDTAQTTLQKDQQMLTTYVEYKQFFQSQKNVLQTTTTKLSDEDGVFNEPATVAMNLNTNNTHEIADYFETVTHEYLHYASFVNSKQKFTDSFFEEALTEYFARQAIKDALHTSTNLGYPIQVKIIMEMMNRIPENQFADVYFTKDESALEETIDTTYGKGFFKNNQILFELIQYASNAQDKLKFANQLMTHLGGNKLKQSDLYSTFSNL